MWLRGTLADRQQPNKLPKILEDRKLFRLETLGKSFPPEELWLKGVGVWGLHG